MTTRRSVRVAVVVAVALLSTGCTADVLGRMKGFDVMQIIRSAPVAEAVQKAKTIGQVLAGIEALILAFVSWYRIHTGTPWLAVTKDWFLGIFVCAFILTAAGTPVGLEQWIWNVGVYLGQQFNPGQGFLMENFNKAVGQHSELILTLQRLAPNLDEETRRIVEAITWQFSSPFMAGFVGLNAIAIYLMKMVMQVSYAWLISFYWMLTPLVAPMVILPQTRGVFLGWLKTYVAVALWPMFFAFAERLALAIPWSAWLGEFDGAVGSWEMATNWFQGELMLLVFNITFFFVYLSIPIASYLIVSGASRPFRNF
ncbi:MAG: hypothetical protein U0599_08325 [Vicinamibacteria bacterium]